MVNCLGHLPEETFHCITKTFEEKRLKVSEILVTNWLELGFQNQPTNFFHEIRLWWSLLWLNTRTLEYWQLSRSSFRGILFLQHREYSQDIRLGKPNRLKCLLQSRNIYRRKKVLQEATIAGWEFFHEQSRECTISVSNYTSSSNGFKENSKLLIRNIRKWCWHSTNKVFVRGNIYVGTSIDWTSSLQGSPESCRNCFEEFNCMSKALIRPNQKKQ